jgi:hypothetical protein
MNQRVSNWFVADPSSTIRLTGTSAPYPYHKYPGQSAPARKSLQPLLVGYAEGRRSDLRKYLVRNTKMSRKQVDGILDRLAVEAVLEDRVGFPLWNFLFHQRSESRVEEVKGAGGAVAYG